jgi:hypothetical protein
MEHAALLDRIRTVDPVHAETMGRQPTRFAVQSLPFYRRFTMVRAAISLPHCAVELRYADDGASLVPLSGAPAAVYRVNDAEPLNLAEGQVADYLRFFLASTTGRDGGERCLVETPADMPWLRRTSSDPALQAVRLEAAAWILPLVIAAVAGGYRAMAVVLEERRLVELELAVDRRGRVTEQATRVLADNLPVAEIL